MLTLCMYQSPLKQHLLDRGKEMGRGLHHEREVRLSSRKQSVEMQYFQLLLQALKEQIVRYHDILSLDCRVCLT